MQFPHFTLCIHTNLIISLHVMPCTWYQCVRACGCKCACANAHEDQTFCHAQDNHLEMVTICNLGSLMQAHKPTARQPLGNNAACDCSKDRTVRIIILLKENRFRNHVLLLLQAALLGYMG